MTIRAAWLYAGASALLLGVGCKQERERASATGREAVEAAQRQSEQALDKAQRAQSEAREQQDEVGRARDRLEQERREFEEAQAQLEQQMQQASSAQKQAQQSAQQAQQVVAQSQQEALRAQEQQAQEQQAQEQQAQDAQPQPQAARQDAPAEQAQQRAQPEQPLSPPEQPPAEVGQQTISGWVVEATNDSLLLRQPGRPDLRIGLDEQTQVLIEGRVASAADLTPGTEVRAAYEPEGEEPMAVRVEVIPSATGGSAEESVPQPPAGQPQPEIGP